MRRLPATSVFLVLFLTLLSGCSSSHLPNVHDVDGALLYRSGQPDATGLAYLRDEVGVRTVINLNTRTTEEEMIRCSALGIAYVPLPMTTYTIDLARLRAFLRAVHQAEAEGRTPVLVHCQFGEDRTGIAVATYRIVEQDWPAEKAIAEMQGYRGWTHRLLIPHLDNILRDIEKNRAEWKRRAAEPGDPPLVMPPVLYGDDESSRNTSNAPPASTTSAGRSRKAA